MFVASSKPKPYEQRHEDYPCSAEELHQSLEKFAVWLEKAGYASYDPYDIWGTGYGKFARRLYYGKHPLGAAFVAPVLLMEMLFPSLRAMFLEKHRYATADAQLVLAFLNLYEAEGARVPPKDIDKKSKNTSYPQEAAPRDAPGIRNDKHDETWTAVHWLNKAKDLADELLTYSIPGYSGYCWGYPFDWQSVSGLIRKNTPLITATPYCFEAYLKLFQLTAETRYLDVVESIAQFVLKDLNETPLSKHASAGSYFPGDNSKVVNASAYRAFVLLEAEHLFSGGSYAKAAMRNLHFILQSQRSDGSWLYAVDSPGESFIDHFHTCFVLKNLYKLNQILEDQAVTRAIKKGYAYYRQELFDPDGSPKSYALEPRLQLSRLEMYNVAEAITLGALLAKLIPEASAMAHRLAGLVMRGYQLNEGYFVTRLYMGSLKHKLPFLRWPQAQLFHSLTTLMTAKVRK